MAAEHIPGVAIDAFELRRVRIPLVTPFRTSFGTETHRDALLVQAIPKGGASGWGECVADVQPLYSPEYVDGAQQVIERYLIPRVFAANTPKASAIAGLLARVQGHPMAKGALEAAVLDAELRAANVSFGAYLGAARARVDCGVSVGIQTSPELLIDVVAGYLESGYKRIKLKIEPGSDVAFVRAIREHFGSELLLSADANASYSIDNPDHINALTALNPFKLLMLEQPLTADDIPAHARLATMIESPICLDESIVTARSAAYAISIGACKIVNIKPGRVGGYLEAVKVHDVCAANGVPVWCGGMLETGIGRAANVALGAMPNFSLPGDTSASSRYFAQDMTEPFVLEAGTLAVPTGPGIGVDPLPESLREFTTSVQLIRR